VTLWERKSFTWCRVEHTYTRTIIYLDRNISDSFYKCKQKIPRATTYIIPNGYNESPSLVGITILLCSIWWIKYSRVWDNRETLDTLHLLIKPNQPIFINQPNKMDHTFPTIRNVTTFWWFSWIVFSHFIPMKRFCWKKIFFLISKNQIAVDETSSWYGGESKTIIFNFDYWIDLNIELLDRFAYLWDSMHWLVETFE